MAGFRMATHQAPEPTMADEPQAAGEQREVARHLVQNPLVTKERDPERFRLIRRHEGELDRWFTQRLGYRLHVDGDTARLYKTGYVPDRRPLRTSTGRPFHRSEYVLLSLVLAATASGPDVISLRDLVEQVRSAAAETGIVIGDERADRRELVTVLSWLIDRGLAVELHARIDAYAADDAADAVLKLRPDRIVLLALPALAGAADAGTLLAQAERRSGTRQWMRARLVEDPVLYRTDLSDAEWGELRRRLGDEGAFLDEMFGLRLEARAEGVAAIDPAGMLAERRFPTTGTIGHAALLLIDQVVARNVRTSELQSGDGADLGDRASRSDRLPMSDVVALVTELAVEHASHWANDMVSAPERLASRVVELLVDLRLADVVDEPPDGAMVEPAVPIVEPGEGDADDDHVPDDGDPTAVQTIDSPAMTRSGRWFRLLPAASRFLAVTDAPSEPDAPQESLW